jgi:hypothetical protein
MTAGNSYGQMDGGVDRVLSQHWPELQRAVWAAIGTSITATSRSVPPRSLPVTTPISRREELLRPAATEASSPAPGSPAAR